VRKTSKFRYILGWRGFRKTLSNTKVRQKLECGKNALMFGDGGDGEHPDSSGDDSRRRCVTNWACEPGGMMNEDRTYGMLLAKEKSNYDK
jgi:hypothetical protein